MYRVYISAQLAVWFWHIYKLLYALLMHSAWLNSVCKLPDVVFVLVSTLLFSETETNIPVLRNKAIDLMVSNAHVNECWQHIDVLSTLQALATRHVVNAPSISQSYFCVVGTMHNSNTVALSIVPVFLPAHLVAPHPSFPMSPFFTQLSAAYKKK